METVTNYGIRYDYPILFLTSLSSNKRSLRDNTQVPRRKVKVTCQTSHQYQDSEDSPQFLSLETMAITVGVLALQGAFFEHVQLLKKAAEKTPSSEWRFIEVRTPQELATCDGLVLPGGESTTMSLVAARSNLLEPLREFVK